MKHLIIWGLLITIISTGNLATPCFAAGYSEVAVPLRVDTLAEGFVVHGQFGNAANCNANSNNWFFVPSSHPQYSTLYSTVLAAKFTNTKIQVYLHQCVATGWHGYTFGTLTNEGMLALIDQ